MNTQTAHAAGQARLNGWQHLPLYIAQACQLAAACVSHAHPLWLRAACLSRALRSAVALQTCPEERTADRAASPLLHGQVSGARAGLHSLSRHACWRASAPELQRRSPHRAQLNPQCTMLTFHSASLRMLRLQAVTPPAAKHSATLLGVQPNDSCLVSQQSLHVVQSAAAPWLRLVQLAMRVADDVAAQALPLAAAAPFLACQSSHARAHLRQPCWAETACQTCALHLCHARRPAAAVLHPFPNRAPTLDMQGS
jgi:hypothetical protein